MRGEELARVTVIGTGMMGPGIALCFALSGREVALVGRGQASLERGQAAFDRALDTLRANGLCGEEQASAALGRLALTSDLPGAAAVADLVVESIVEDLASKQALFAQLENHCAAGTIITSNTSGLRITEIAARIGKPGRTATTHFWMPPHLVPLVEIVRGERTDDRTVELLFRALEQAGKSPVVVRKDVLGQLGARLLAAITREAMYLVQQGVATAEEVDTAVKMGLGIRFPAYGPLEHSDIAGLDLVGAVQSYLFRDLCNSTEPLPIMKEKAAAGELGAKSGKGFYDWAQKDPDEVRRRRDQFIIGRVKELRAGEGKSQG